MKRISIILTLITALMAVGAGDAAARRLNDKLENRPYADLRPWHLGFSIGAYTEDLRLSHNGLITEQGEQWRAEQVNYQPGFAVTALMSLRLGPYFSARISPGMLFGSRDIRFLDLTTGATQRQNIKSTYVVTPVDIKYSAMRVRNARPYLTAGVMPVFDVSKKRNDLLKLKTADVMLTVGLGCDFYLPFFKFNPEIKFAFGLGDVLVHDRPDLADDPDRLKFTQSLARATSKMIILTFYFE